MFKKIAYYQSNYFVNKAYLNALVSSYALMGVTIIIQIFMVPLYLEHLGKEKFGLLVMILSAINYVAIGIGWLSGGMARILAEYAAKSDVEGFRSAYAFAKWLYVGYACFGTFVFWVIAPLILPDVFKEDELVIALILSSIYLILLYEYNADRVALIARQWQFKSNINEIIGQVVFAGNVLVGLKVEWSISGVLLAQISGIMTTRCLAWCCWRKDFYHLTWMSVIPNSKDLWNRISGKMGREYIVYGILVLTLQSDVLVLGWLGGMETVTSYYLLWRIPEVVLLLLLRIPGTYSPLLISMDTRGKYKELEVIYKRWLYLIFFCAGLIAFLYSLIGSWIVNIWVYDNAVAENVDYLFAAAAMFFLAVTRWPVGVAYSLLNTKSLNVISSIEFVGKLFLIILLYPEYGYMAPIISTFIVYIVYSFWMYLWLGNNTLKKLVDR